MTFYSVNNNPNSEVNLSLVSAMVETIEIKNFRLGFSKEAMAVFDEKHPNASRVRVEMQDGDIRIRPTVRKYGPHVLVSLERDSKGGAHFSLTAKEVSSLGIPIKDPGTKYDIVEDKYGWFRLVAQTEHKHAA